MRKSFVSLFSVLFFILFSSSAHAVPADQLPGHANERFYPDSVQKIQEEPSWIQQSFCRVFGFVNSFGCEGIRTQHILSPEELKAEVSDEEAGAVKPGLGTNSQVQGANSQQEEIDEFLTHVEQELTSATTEGEVLAIQDFIDSFYSKVFGGGDAGTGFINTYKPNGVEICDNPNNAQDCTEKLAIALLPASLQEETIAQRPSVDQPPDSSISPEPVDLDGDGVPDTPIGPSPNPIPTFPIAPGGTGNALVNGFQGVCAYNNTPGRVHRTNVDCLNYVVPKLVAGAISEMRNSAVAYADLQCVGFVRGANIQFKGQALDNGGNANMFATNIPTGYRLVRSASLTTSPKVGDLMLWNTGAFGHIAYVSVVYDKDNVGIIEANFGTPGKVQFRPLYVRAPDILGWLTR